MAVMKVAKTDGQIWQGLLQVLVASKYGQIYLDESTSWLTHWLLTSVFDFTINSKHYHGFCLCKLICLLPIVIFNLVVNNCKTHL